MRPREILHDFSCAVAGAPLRPGTRGLVPSRSGPGGPVREADERGPGRDAPPGERPGREACKRRCASSWRPRPGAPRRCSAATLAALAWVNIDSSSYESRLAHRALDPGRRLGHLAESPRLGQQRADDLLLLRRRSRGAPRVRCRRAAAAPARSPCRSLAALGGMLVPVAIYLAINAGHSSTHGWGVAMSTDTAFALGMLALVGPTLSRSPAGFHADDHRRR